jgi:molybdenum cofactor guanylyltransferase
VSPSVSLVVLAGGTSRRFGTDKLAADVGGMILLDRCLADLPAEWELVVVGPDRDVGRRAVVTREDPVGSGPAAAVVAGVAAAGGEIVVTTPGDVPAGSAAAVVLVDALLASTADAVIGVDAQGQDQPLQFAVRRAAVTAVATLGTAAADRSARRLFVPLLSPLRVPLARDHTLDIDTVEAAERYPAS